MASEIRALLYQTGNVQMGEILFSFCVDGNKIYNFKTVNEILKKFSMEFSDENVYKVLVEKMEQTYKVYHLFIYINYNLHTNNNNNIF